MVEVKEVQEVEPGPSGSVFGQRVIYLIVGIVESLLGIRFVLSLLGANMGNPFAEFVMNLTAPIVAPFQSLFNYHVKYGIANVELETLMAMFVVALIGYGLMYFFKLPQRGNDV